MKRGPSKSVASARRKLPPVGLGDLVRVLGKLESTLEERLCFARLLDVRLPDPTLDEPPPERPPPEPPKLPWPPGLQPPSNSIGLDSQATPEPSTKDGEEDFSFQLLRSLRTSGPPSWLVSVNTLPPPTQTELAGPPELLPLLEPAWTRNILSAVLSTSAEEGDVDDERLLASVARCEPATTLPRGRLSTLRRGAQVMVDTSEAMAPFRRDLGELLDRIGTVMGEGRAQILHFEGDPLQIRPDKAARKREPSRFWVGYAPPSPGTPVLLLSDLGLRRPQRVQRWIEFARTVRRASCPLIALCPYPKSRFTAPLIDLVTIVHWDRATTVAAARRIVRRNLRRSA